MPEYIGRRHALRGFLQQLLLDVLDATALLRGEVSCPLVLDGPVVAERTGTADSARAERVGGPLLVRRSPIPPTHRLSPSVLLSKATDATGLERAAAVPILLSHLLDALLARWTAEATARGALEIANRDPATGLGNRRAWMNTLRVESARAARTGRPLAVLNLDIDGLKAINDIHGHAAGDRHIARTAAVLARAARITDQVCRLGGDEFGVAAPVTNELQARLLADRLRSSLLAEGLHVSIGWAVSIDETSRDNLWHAADASM